MSVETIIGDLHLEHKARPQGVQQDATWSDPEVADNLSRRHAGVSVSAVTPATLRPLIERVQSMVEALQTAPAEPGENRPDDGSPDGEPEPGFCDATTRHCG